MLLKTFADETILYGQAIAHTNRLGPDFVVMFGDMTHDDDDLDQLDELRRITAKLDDPIPWYRVAGAKLIESPAQGLGVMGKAVWSQEFI